jgi:hypothetical protein
VAWRGHTTVAAAAPAALQVVHLPARLGFTLRPGDDGQGTKGIGVSRGNGPLPPYSLFVLITLCQQWLSSETCWTRGARGAVLGSLARRLSRDVMTCPILFPRESILFIELK